MGEVRPVDGPGQVAKEAADVGGDQVEDGCHGGGKAFDDEASVEKDGGDPGTGKEVLHVAVALVQLFHLPLQLGVDSDQLLVQGLQLLLGGLQLFVGGLKFLVGGLELFIDRHQLFVGRQETLIGCFELLGGCLELFVGDAELFLQLADQGVL